MCIYLQVCIQPTGLFSVLQMYNDNIGRKNNESIRDCNTSPPEKISNHWSITKYLISKKYTSGNVNVFI